MKEHKGRHNRTKNKDITAHFPCLQKGLKLDSGLNKAVQQKHNVCLTLSSSHIFKKAKLNR